MAGTKGEEAIVEGYEEIGRKRVNYDKDVCPAKRMKVEGNDEAADCRNLGDQAEGEAAGDGTEEELKKERLRMLLEDDPKKMRNRDEEDVIRYFDVDEIIRMALKSDQGSGISDYGYLQGGSYVPSCEKVVDLLRLMIVRGGIEKLEEVDLLILYQNFPKMSFAQLLFIALDSYAKRFRRGGAIFDKANEYVMLSRLCCALPWKLFSYIMYDRTKLPQFKRSEKEELDEQHAGVQKKAAESCEICYGKGKHSGVYGYHCSFWDYVPSGLTVGPSHRVLCRDCYLSESNDFVMCLCGSRFGMAVPCSVIWDY